MTSSYYGLLFILVALFHGIAVSSPIHQHCRWEDIRDHARNLSDLAMKFYNTKQTKDNVALENPRIQCEHRCGPQDLSLNKTKCLQHIHHVLSYFKKLLDILPADDLKNYDMSHDIKSIKHVISHLLHCLQHYEDTSKTIPRMNVTTNFVKTKFGTPLASSSSLIARVFAAGDPSNHWLRKKH